MNFDDSKKIYNIYELIQSSYSLHAIYVLTKIGAFDLIEESPQSLNQISKFFGIDTSFFKSLLSLSVALRFIRIRDDRYYITRRGRTLTKRNGSWLRYYLLVWGQQLNPAFNNLQKQLQSGENAFQLFHGNLIWDFYKIDPLQNDVFVEFQNRVTKQVHVALISELINIDDSKNFVDVAGGIGSLTCALISKYEYLKATICDQPSNAAKAIANIKAQGLIDSCDFVGVNIFDSIPFGHDLYLIKHVLHDWDDANAISILTSISNAMRPDSRLIIIEGVSDREFAEGFINPEHLLTRDIEQRIWTSGRVRSSLDFDKICEAAKLKILSIKHSSIIDISFIEIKKAPYLLV